MSQALIYASPLIALDFVLRIAALVSLNRQKGFHGRRWLWGLFIMLIAVFGWATYFLHGRKKGQRR